MLIRTKYGNNKSTNLPAVKGQRICPARNQNNQLTLKEELFVRAICCYPEDPSFDNMSQAMNTAGYKGKHIGIYAYQLMQKPKIANAVEKYRQRIMAEFDIAPKKILQEIAATAFSDFGDFYSDDGTLKNLKQLSKASRLALHKVKVQYGLGPDGNPAVTQDIQLHDKLKGLELLGKYHKLWTDNVNITNIDSELSADERAAQTRQRLLEGLKIDTEDGE